MSCEREPQRPRLDCRPHYQLIIEVDGETALTNSFSSPCACDLRHPVVPKACRGHSLGCGCKKTKGRPTHTKRLQATLRSPVAGASTATPHRARPARAAFSARLGEMRNRIAEAMACRA